MKKIRMALFIAASLCSCPLGLAHAQSDDEEESSDEAGKDEEAAGAKKGKGKAGGKGKPGAKAADEEGGEEEADAEASDKKAGDEEGGDEEGGDEEGGDEEGGGEEGEGGAAAEEGGGLKALCQIDPDACPKFDLDKEAQRDIHEQRYAVQQVFAMRARRFELMPYWSFTLNDQFVSHPGPGVGLNYWVTNVLAVGVNGNYYQPFNSDSSFNFQARRAARIGVPLTEYQWGAHLNLTYTPVAGKFAGFGDFIFQYDAYVVLGAGMMSTRPIPVIDPDNRFFDFQQALAFNGGIGLRIFFSRWFAADLEVRDYVFQDRLENLKVAGSPNYAGDPSDKSTWYGDKRITNNVQAQLGVSIFIPFSFEYRLPR